MTEITVPRLGWTMEEGTFVGWLKKEGEHVQAGEPLFTLDGDKALQEVEATESGMLRISPNGPAPGTTVRVGDLLGHLLVEGEIAQFPTSKRPVEETSGSNRETANYTPTLEPRPPTTSTFEQGRPERRAISPRALRKATELGIKWSALTGTGRGGRIRERDILSAAPSAATGHRVAVPQPG